MNRLLKEIVCLKSPTSRKRSPWLEANMEHLWLVHNWMFNVLFVMFGHLLGHFNSSKGKLNLPQTYTSKLINSIDKASKKFNYMSQKLSHSRKVEMFGQISLHMTKKSHFR